MNSFRKNSTNGSSTSAPVLLFPKQATRVSSPSRPSLSIVVLLDVKPASPSVQPNQQAQHQVTLPNITPEHVIDREMNDKSKIPVRTRPPTHTNLNRWNTSTHAKPNPYVPDLPDAYPRDPFTKMPPKRDALEVYRLLQSRPIFIVQR